MAGSGLMPDFLFTPGETPSMSKVAAAAGEGLQRRREERDGNGTNGLN